MKSFIIKQEMKKSRLQELILLILDRAHKEGIKNLSRFQLMKLVFLIEVEALKYAGSYLIQPRFLRYKNGPISMEIYTALDLLSEQGYIYTEEQENKKYGYPRVCHSLKNKLGKLEQFNQGEIVFIDTVLSDLLPLSQKELQKLAYSTEPMKARLEAEKGTVKEGVPLNMDLVTTDKIVLEPIDE